MRRDSPTLFFGASALLTLTVSIPATFSLLRPFHDAGGWLGSGLAVFAMLVFEIGAVGSKLITLAVPEWRGRLLLLTLTLLALTTAGNYLHGVELFRSAELPPTLASLRSAGYGPWLALGASALFPALLFVWLTAFVARVERVSQTASIVTRLTGERDTFATQLDQTAADRDALGMQLRQALADLEHASVQIASLPDESMVQIAGRAYTTRQLASAFEVSEPTVRRRLKGVDA